MKELPKELADFPSERSIRALKRFVGLRYIVLIPQFIAGFNALEFNSKIRSYENQISLLQMDSQGNYLFELTAKQDLDSTFSLLAPSYPPYPIALELETGTDTPVSSEILDVFINQDKIDLPSFSINIEKSKSSRWYSLEIPPQKDLVRPIKISFKSRYGSTIKLVKSQVQ